MMSTKELILHSAIKLFNEHGTAKVSTNHIAKEAGISPGNLYYHFKDKSQIIQEIYELMIQVWEQAYDQAEGRDMLVEVLQKFIEDNFELLWQYRFFYRETVALINADPILSKRHCQVSKERFERQRLLLQKGVQDGILFFPEPEIQLDDVLTIAWIVANHYLIYLESMGRQVEKHDFVTGAELVVKVLQPYYKRNS